MQNRFYGAKHLENVFNILLSKKFSEIFSKLCVLTLLLLIYCSNTTLLQHQNQKILGMESKLSAMENEVRYKGLINICYVDAA